MDARIALPGGVAMAMVLGIGFSALVPTRMVAAESPSWANSVPQHQSYDADDTWQFAEAPPVDLNPSIPVGPQYDLGDDAMGYAVPVATMDSREADVEPVYVAVDYDAATNPPPPPVQTEAEAIRSPLAGTIY